MKIWKGIKAFFIFLFAVAAIWFGASAVRSARRKKADQELKLTTARSRTQAVKVREAKRSADEVERAGHQIVKAGQEKLDELQNRGHNTLAGAGRKWNKRVRDAKLRASERPGDK